eukprot:scpid53380/ scgid22328/ Bone morphogenetic protein 2-A; BMP-2-I
MRNGGMSLSCTPFVRLSLVVVACYVACSQARVHMSKTRHSSEEDADIALVRKHVARGIGLTVDEADSLERRAAAAAAQNRPSSQSSDNADQTHDTTSDRQPTFGQLSPFDGESATTSANSILRRYDSIIEEIEGSDSGEKQHDMFTVDLRGWPAEEDVALAELLMSPQLVASVMSENPYDSPLVTVTVTDAYHRESGGNSKHDANEHFATDAVRFYFLHGREWCAIDVTSLVQRWLGGDKTGLHSFNLRVSPGPSVVDEENVLKELQLNFSVPREQRTAAPVLYTYSHQKTKRVSEHSLHQARLRRDTDTDQPTNEHLVNHEQCLPHPDGTNFNRLARQCNSYCQLFDVDTMGWGQFIIAPMKFEMGYCAGDCKFPLVHGGVDARRYLDANGISRLQDKYKTTVTRHAHLQARLAVENAELPVPKCVPLSYTLLTVLYLDSRGRTVVKPIRDLKVRQCGCA